MSQAEMSGGTTAGADHTLIIPTRNRPALLRQNLTFLRGQGFRSRLIVLDSSDDAERADNRRCLAELGFADDHVQYDPATPVYEKFVDGTKRVETPFSSFLADDDLLFVEILEKSIDVLRDDPTVEVAHGLYFMFDFLPGGQDIDLTMMIYAAPSLDQVTPLRRLNALMRSYQALCYGVFRTPVLQATYRHVSNAPSLLFAELLSSIYPILTGKAVRLRQPYMARRHAQPSEGLRQRWHPLEWFMRDADDLMAHYGDYRAILLQALADHGVQSTIHVKRIVDLIHLSYLDAHVPTDAVEILMEKEESGLGIDQYWTDNALQLSLIHAHSAALPRPDDSLLVRVADIFPGQFDESSREVVAWPLMVATSKRAYKFERTFLDDRLSNLVPFSGDDILRLVATLDGLDNMPQT